MTLDIIIGILAAFFVALLIYKKYREVKYGECAGCSHCSKGCSSSKDCKSEDCKNCPHSK